MVTRVIAWIAMFGGNVAVGLLIADPRTHATAAGWVAFAAGSLLWELFFAWALLSPRDAFGEPRGF